MLMHECLHMYIMHKYTSDTKAQSSQGLMYSLVSIKCLVVNLFSPLFVHVFSKEPLDPMKQRLKEEEEGGEELAHKAVKRELAETMKVKLEGHIQVHKTVFVIGWYSLCAWLVMGPPIESSASTSVLGHCMVVAFCIEVLQYMWHKVCKH